MSSSFFASLYDDKHCALPTKNGAGQPELASWQCALCPPLNVLLMTVLNLLNKCPHMFIFSWTPQIIWLAFKKETFMKGQLHYKSRWPWFHPKFCHDLAKYKGLIYLSTWKILSYNSKTMNVASAKGFSRGHLLFLPATHPLPNFLQEHFLLTLCSSEC